MKSFSTSRRVSLSRGRGRLALLAIAMLAIGSNFAHAQVAQQPAVVGLQAGTLGRPYPSPLYFQVFPALNDGDYKNAYDGFRRESAGGLKIGATRWIDSVCGYTMAGECQYRLGNYAVALENFNAALQLYAQYSDWMINIQFPDSTPAQTTARPAPWGKSTRGSRPGRFPETLPISVGQNQAQVNQVVQKGGAVMPQQVLPMHVHEIVRCTCLAMYRRREILGPLASFDPLTEELVAKASRRGGRPNHWSEAWIDVTQGIAYSSAGKTGQAIPLLQRSLLAQGQCDHPLTGLALLELGRLSMNSGDYKTAAGYFEEATYTGFDYSDGMVMEEGFRNLFLAHYLIGDLPTLDLAFAAAAQWAKGNFRELQASVLLLAAESNALRGQTSQATGFIADANNVIGRRFMGLCEIGSRLHYLTAMTNYQRAAVSGDKGQSMVTAGDNELKTALTWQETGCRRLFQISFADKLCTTNPGGRFGARAALALYAELLRDPTASEWNMRPLESLAIMLARHTEPYEHWFETVIGQDPQAASELAIEVADLARRHRFLTSLPLGGRLMALRWVLESPADALDNPSKLQRQELIARYPKYAELGEKIKQLRADLAANGLTFENAESQRIATAKYNELATLSNAQETILHEMSVRREAADIVFPPIPKMKVVQKMLAPGQLLLAFFTTSKTTHGWLFSSDRYAIWKLDNPAALEKKTAAMLKAMGNFDGTRELQENQLTDEGWKQAARDTLDALLKNSKINFNSGINELIIVPDGSLWYLPFEMLPVGDPKEYRPLISKVRVRYTPTVGLALPVREGRKPAATLGVALGKLYPNDNAETIDAAWEEMKRASDHAVALRGSLPGPSPMVGAQLDSLVVLDDVPAGPGAFEWSPMPLDRSKSAGALSAWMMLPWKNVDQFVLPGFHTAAENGMKVANPTPGMEMFLATTGLMSTGARTILISRWRTGGHTALQLIREFVQELPFSTADEAWQRAVDLVTKSPLDPLREPRIRRKQDAAPLNADHPFFWAGYMLIDTGASPEKDPGGVAQPEKRILKFEEKKKPGAAQPEKKADQKPAENNAEKKTEGAAPPANQGDAPALPQPTADAGATKNS